MAGVSALDIGLRVVFDPGAVRAYVAECERIDRAFAAGDATESRMKARDLAKACAEETLFEAAAVEFT